MICEYCRNDPAWAAGGDCCRAAQLQRERDEALRDLGAAHTACERLEAELERMRGLLDDAALALEHADRPAQASAYRRLAAQPKD